MLIRLSRQKRLPSNKLSYSDNHTAHRQSPRRDWAFDYDCVLPSMSRSLNLQFLSSLFVSSSFLQFSTFHSLIDHRIFSLISSSIDIFQFFSFFHFLICTHRKVSGVYVEAMCTHCKASGVQIRPPAPPRRSRKTLIQSARVLCPAPRRHSH
jgi:hypothetical protein